MAQIAAARSGWYGQPLDIHLAVHGPSADMVTERMQYARGYLACGAFLIAGACQTPTELPPVVPAKLATMQTAAPTAPAPSAQMPKPWVNVADRAEADQINRAIPNPGMVDLTAVSATEAEIGLGGLGARQFAVINLDSGCIVATREERQTLAAHAGQSNARLIEYLESSAFARDEAQSFAYLRRFDLHLYSAVMTRTRSDSTRAISADGRKMAIQIGHRIFFSANGGQQFSRIDQTTSSESVGSIYFSPDEKLLFVDFSRTIAKQTSFFTGVIQVDNDPPKPIGEVALADFTSLRAFSASGKPLHAHLEQRCIHELNPASLTLDKLLCLNGPKMPSDFFFGPDLSPSGTVGIYIEGQARGVASIFDVSAGAHARTIPSKFNAQAYQSDVQGFHIGPDDAGRFAWDAHQAFRVATPTGVFDNAWLQPTGKHTPMGFDLAGNILWFNQPPLERPHLPMTLMPPAKGTLGDSLCTLITRTDPTRGKKILPPL